MATSRDRDLAARVQRTLVELGWQHDPNLRHLPDLIRRHGTKADEWPRSGSFEPGSKSTAGMSPVEAAALATPRDTTPIKLAQAADAILACDERFLGARAAVQAVLNPKASVPGFRGDPMFCRFCLKRPARYGGGGLQLCEADEKFWRRIGRPMHDDGTPNLAVMRGLPR